MVVALGATSPSLVGRKIGFRIYLEEIVYLWGLAMKNGEYGNDYLFLIHNLSILN